MRFLINLNYIQLDNLIINLYSIIMLPIFIPNKPLTDSLKGGKKKGSKKATKKATKKSTKKSKKDKLKK